MRKIWATHEDVMLEETAKAYFVKKAGVYPEMLHLILKDEAMAEIRNKMKDNETLSLKEQDRLVKKYIDEQSRYKSNCVMLADWAELNAELLFLDSMGTDISGKIYQITDEDIKKTKQMLSTLPEEESKLTKLKLAKGILNMTDKDLAEYQAVQKSVFFSLGQ